MATSVYMQNRWAYSRPQAIAWSNNSGSVSGGIVVPQGNEFEDFIILSDHNRREISMSQNRIENRKRMINGNMRSYHIADKLSISWDWEMLPSRSYSGNPNYNAYGNPVSGLTEYTADGGAGGVDIVKWYEEHPGSFYMFMAYDRHDKFDGQNDEYDHLNQYNDIVEVYFSSFNFNIVKRGGSNFDFWNISVELEEV
jgi:hypothetical protein